MIVWLKWHLCDAPTPSAVYAICAILAASVIILTLAAVGWGK